MSNPSLDKIREWLEYDPRTGIFTWKAAACLRKASRMRVGSVAGSKNNRGYWQIVIDGRAFLAHRLAWFHQTGVWPKEEIDHFNGIRSDNRFENLREADRYQNMRNKAKTRANRSGFKGVRAHMGKWEANIRAGGKQKYLGLYETPELAHAAYVAAAEKYYGEFARVE